MDRGIPVSSKIISKKINDRNREIHLKKLNNIKSSLNTKAPPTFSHLKPDNKKKNKFKDTRLAEIEAENKNLLDKLTQIMKPKDREALAQQNGQGRSLNHDYRKRELVKITIENEAFLKRLQEQRPTYTSSNWQRDHVQNKLYLRNICEFPMMPASTKGLRMTEENGELSRNGTSSFNSVRNNGTGSKNFNSTFTNKFNQSQTKLGPLKKPNTGKLDPIEDSSAKSILYQGKKKIGLGNYLIHVYIHNDLFNIVASNNDRSDFKTLSISRREGEILIRKFDGDLEELTNYIKFRGNKIIIDTSAEHQEDLTNIEEASVDKNEDQAGIVIIEKDTKVVAEQEEPKIVEQPKTQPSSANHSEGSQEARNQKDRLSNVPEEESPEKRKQTVEEEEEEAVNAKEEQEEKEEQQEQEENNGEEENVEAEENKEEVEEGVDEEVGEDI